MKRIVAVVLFVLLAGSPPAPVPDSLTLARSRQSPAAKPSDRGWPAYGGGPEQIRYSTLAQINRGNVKELKQAWIYDSGETGGLQTQPIVVDGVLYGVTPRHKTFALRAATGEHLWTFDSGIKAQGANRGVMYWTDGAGDRRVYAAVTRYVYALDAGTGKPIPTFGDGGRIDLHGDLGRDPGRQSVVLTSPGVVHKDLLILGGRVSEGLPSSPGDIRAYNARTGKLQWSFHTIPHPGEAGYETWSKDSWKENGGANSWPGMALDEARGIVYVPTGSAAADFYGANRVGDNLYANFSPRAQCRYRQAPLAFSVRAARHLGSRRAGAAKPDHHHAEWKADRRRRAGDETRLRLRVRSNERQADLPDRKPKVSARAMCPAKPRPRHSRSRLKPAPFSRQVLNAETVTSRTPEARAWALAELAKFSNDGLFVPLSVGRQTVIFPGFDGGAEWGGQAFDPETGLYYVNANDLAWTGGLAPAVEATTGRGIYQQNCATCHGTICRVRHRRSRPSSASASARPRLRYPPSLRKARAGCPASPISRPPRCLQSSSI